MSEPGFYQGRHYTEYVDHIKELKRAKAVERLEPLLNALIEVVETESKAEGMGVAPWYYQELARIHRDRQDLTAERQVLERFAKQQHALGVTPPRLMERLEQLRQQPEQP